MLTRGPNLHRCSLKPWSFSKPRAALWPASGTPFHLAPSCDTANCQSGGLQCSVCRSQSMAMVSGKPMLQSKSDPAALRRRRRRGLLGLCRSRLSPVPALGASCSGASLPAGHHGCRSSRDFAEAGTSGPAGWPGMRLPACTGSRDPLRRRQAHLAAQIVQGSRAPANAKRR